MKNKLKIHNYAILNYKYSAKKTTGQWTYIYGQDDQRVIFLKILKKYDNSSPYWAIYKNNLSKQIDTGMKFYKISEMLLQIKIYEILSIS